MSFLDKLVNTNLDENVGPKSKEYSRIEPEDTPRFRRRVQPSSQSPIDQLNRNEEEEKANTYKENKNNVPNKDKVVINNHKYVKTLAKEDEETVNPKKKRVMQPRKTHFLRK